MAADEFDETPPADLGESGRTVWHETIATFKRQGTFNAAYRPALVDHCRKCDELANLRATIAAEGELVTLPNGIQTAHAACKLREKCERAINDFRKAFGLTAASCATIGIRPVAPTMSALQRFKTEGSMGIATRNRQDPVKRIVTPEEYDELVEAAYFGPEEGKREAFRLLCECIDPRPHAVAARERKQPPQAS